MKYIFSIILAIISTNSFAAEELKILNRGNGSEVDSLNIHLAEGLNSHNVLRDLYEGLMTLNELGEPIYGAAASHSVKINVWTFKLRKDGRWSDGTQVVAGDFVRGWRQAVDPKTAAPFAFLLNNIVAAKKIIQMKLGPDNLVVKALDDFTLEIQLSQPDSAFLEKLILPIFYPVAKAKTGNHQIISNGAYHLSEWNIQEKIVLEKNRYYKDISHVYFDRVNYWVTENQSSELKRFRAGELDITESIPDSQIHWIQQNLANQLHVFPYLGSFFLGLNLSDMYLKNTQLRQALSMAINRDILTQKVLKTGQQPAYHIVPRDLISGDEKIEINQQQRNIRAKELLKQSGVNVSELTIEILYNNSENQKKVALAIAAMWRQTLGIRTQLLNQEWKVFVNSRKSNKRQAFRSGWIADYADALSFLELFASDSRFNFYHYHNQNYDDLLVKISAATQAFEKNNLIRQAEYKLLHDLPVIPLYYYVSRHLVNSQMMGFVDNVADRHLSKYLYRTEKEK